MIYFLVLHHVIVKYISYRIYFAHVLECEILINKDVPLHGRNVLKHRHRHNDLTAIGKIDRHLASLLREVQSLDSDLNVWHLAHNCIVSPRLIYLQNNSSSESSANLADNAFMAARSGSKSLVMISLTKSISISK